jgi:hypothetical protein
MENNELERLRKSTEELRDEKLIEIVTAESQDYTAEAVEIAKEELLKRNIDPASVQEEYEKEKDKDKNEIIDDAPELLITVPNSTESSIIESLLNSYDIPVLRKAKGVGGLLEVYTGVTQFGVDLYVPSKLIEKAKNILENQVELQDNSVESDQIELQDNLVEPDQIEEPDFYNEEKKHRNLRSAGSWVILLFFLSPVLIVLLICLIFFLLKIVRWII